MSQAFLIQKWYWIARVKLCQKLCEVFHNMAANDRSALSSFRKEFLLLFGMRQRRQLGERRAKATMVSRLSAKPSGHWEKLSRRAIFPNVSGLCDGGAIEAQIFNFALKLNRRTTVELCSFAPLLQNPC